MIGTALIGMANAGFVIGSYAVTLAGIGLYTWRMLRRARSMASQVPPEDRPWT